MLQNREMHTKSLAASFLNWYLFRYNDAMVSEMNFHLRFYSHVHHFIACGFDKMYFCANKKLNRYESERSDFYLNKRFLVFSFPLLFMCAHVLFECVCIAWEWKSNTKQSEWMSERTNEGINKKDEQRRRLLPMLLLYCQSIHLKNTFTANNWIEWIFKCAQECKMYMIYDGWKPMEKINSLEAQPEGREKISQNKNFFSISLLLCIYFSYQVRRKNEEEKRT